MDLQLISRNRSFDGWHCRFQHQSRVNQCTMTFAIYLPPCSDNQKVPVLYWLSGLTCTDENFMQKAGARKMASELGLAVVVPDTSPRGDHVADDPAYDLGQGAGFYLNATRSPWMENYQMYDYVVTELPEIIAANFPVSELCSISGHSMGGHGALTAGLKNPEKYRSISAFSPIVNPTCCSWGRKAFTHYLGSDENNWKHYDACILLSELQTEGVPPILIDQGEDDEFLDSELKLQNFEKLAKNRADLIKINRHPGYDHSYFFIESYIDSHLQFHMNNLV